MGSGPETVSGGVMSGQRRLVATSTLVMAAATLMQYSLPALGPLLTEELELSDAAYGSLFTVYYGVCTIGSLVLGGPTQRIGARWGMALVVLIAAAGLGGVGLAPSVAMIYVGLALSGVASALANPATNLALMSVPNRGPAVGIKQSGVQISALLSGVAVTPLALLMGWRDALTIGAAVCLVVLVPVILTDRGSDRQGITRQRARPISSIAGLALFAFLMGCGLASTTAYLPLYATEDLGLSARTGGYLLGIFGVSAVAGRIAWGMLSQRSARFARPATALSVMAGGAVMAAVLLGGAGAGVPSLVFVGVVVMGLTGAAWNGLLMMFVMDSADPATSGRSAGRVQSAFFGGLCISPLLFGLLSDRTGSFAYVWLGTAGAYVLALVAARTLVTGGSRAGRRVAEPASLG
jgi:MFS family permease